MNSLLGIPLEKLAVSSNGSKTTSLLTYTEASKLVIKGTGEAVKCHLYGKRVKTNDYQKGQKRKREEQRIVLVS